MLASLAAFAAATAYAGNTFKDIAGFTELDEVTDFTLSDAAGGYGWNAALVKSTTAEGGTKNIYGTNTITTATREWQNDAGLGFYISKNSTVNLGTIDGSKTGSLTFKKTNANSLNGTFLSEAGSTFNIGKGSEFSLYPNYEYGRTIQWGPENVLNGTINVYGKFNLHNAMEVQNVYTNLNETSTINLYAGSEVYLYNLVHKGTINIYGAPAYLGIDTYGVRGVNAWKVTGDTAKFGIYANGAFDNVKLGEIALNGKLTVDVGNTETAIKNILLPSLNFATGGGVDFNFANIAGGASYGIKGLTTTEESGEGYLNFNNFYNDLVYFEGEYTVAADGTITLASGLSVILEAYDSTGALIDGDWSIKQVGEKFFLNNSAASPIPEPATCATIFGMLALLLAFYHKK